MLFPFKFVPFSYVANPSYIFFMSYLDTFVSCINGVHIACILSNTKNSPKPAQTTQPADRHCDSGDCCVYQKYIHTPNIISNAHIYKSTVTQEDFISPKTNNFREVIMSKWGEISQSNDLGPRALSTHLPLSFRTDSNTVAVNRMFVRCV